MANPTPTVEGFSLSHAAIIDPTTGIDAAFGNLYGVRSASISVAANSYDNTGDDAIQSTWYWADKATVTVQGGYVPFQTLAYISGSKLSSSGSGATMTYSLPLWEINTMNTVPRPMLVRLPSKDSAGAIRTLDFLLYKVQFEPFAFDGPNYKAGLLLNYNGSALFSSTDELGNQVLDSNTGLPSRQIGRIVSHT